MRILWDKFSGWGRGKKANHQNDKFDKPLCDSNCWFKTYLIEMCNDERHFDVISFAVLHYNVQNEATYMLTMRLLRHFFYHISQSAQRSWIKKQNQNQQ